MNFNELKDPTALEDGTHEVVCDDAQIKTARTGSHMIVCKFKTDSGKVMFYNFVTRLSNGDVNYAGGSKLAKFCKLAGSPEITSDFNDSNFEHVAKLNGLRVKATVKNKFNDFKGDTRPEIVDFVG